MIGVDIGGATTDVFSVFGEIFNRTVSANLGMSYSVSNVLAEAGIENILRWVPFAIDESELRNRIKNKMIRPTTIPQTLEELMIEQAIGARRCGSPSCSTRRSRWGCGACSASAPSPTPSSRPAPARRSST